MLELWDKKRDKTCDNLQLHMHRGSEEVLGEANPSDPIDMGCAPKGCSRCQSCTSAAPHLVCLCTSSFETAMEESHTDYK